MNVVLERFVGLVLALGCMVSALLVIHSSYQSRVMVNELRHLRSQGDLLAATNERLQLDVAWSAGQTRIDKEARQQLGMVPVVAVSHMRLTPGDRHE